MASKKTKSSSVVWFRNDLRTHDNEALTKAMENGPTTAVYFLTPANWHDHALSPAKVDFICRTLAELKDTLAGLNVQLVVLKSTFDECGAKLVEICRLFGASAVFCNKEYEELSSAGITMCVFEDQCVIPPGRVKTQQGKPYTVFTPFKNAWIKYIEADMSLIDPLKCPSPQHRPDPVHIEGLVTLLSMNGDERFEIKDQTLLDTLRTLWPAGEDAARSRLEQFSELKAKNYSSSRDFPSVQTDSQGTSRLSPYFAIGALSIRLALQAALQKNKLSFGGDPGISTWISELCWRDFYRNILVSFPRVCRNQPFQLVTKAVRWRECDSDLNSWKTGRTGFPIVDAGMRELKATGYMHNRVRMITAMFLTKHLLIDWRKGETYFMRNLIDGDFASNNGGWQWSASTGTDSQPYFRVFNPYLQSERFDADGSYIRKWVPELRSVKGKAIHNPCSALSKAEFEKLGYPRPIVDHAEARKRAIEEFKRVFKKTGAEPQY